MGGCESGIKVAVSSVKSRYNAFNGIWDGILSFLFLCGILLNLNSAAHNQAYIIPIFVLCALFPIVMCLFSQSKRFGILFWLIPIISAVFCIVLFSKGIANGFIMVCNELLSRVGETCGRIVTQFELIRRLSGLDITVFMIFAVSVLSLIIVPCVKRGSVLLPLVISAAVSVFFCGTASESQVGIFMLLIASAAFIVKKISHGFAIYDRRVFVSKVLVLLCCAVIGGVVLAVDNEGKMEALSVVHRSVRKSADKLIYGGCILPDGDFSKVGDFIKSDQPQLEVVMSDPDSYYLRGFVGSVYSSQGWENIENKNLYKNSDLFYWLHESGFYGQTQISQIAQLTGDEQLNRITIKNVGSSAKYLYTPYEVSASENDFLSADGIGDQALSIGSMIPRKSYTYYASSNQVKKYTELLRNISESEEKSDKKYKEYLNSESHYNEFVYSNYMDIPESVSSLLKNLLGEYDAVGGHCDYAQAKQKILSFLTGNMTYSEEAEASDRDFVSTFLNETKSGYSVHFATAATLMFRYYGIPARYVEGYLITPEDVEGVSANSAITIDGTHAHAWTEFYQDGVGWIPFETTPTYLDIMEKADDIKGEQYNEKQSDTDDTEQDNSKTQHGVSEMIRQKSDKILNIFIVVVLTLVGVLITASVIIIMRRRNRLKALRRSFESDDIRLAVNNMFAYCVELLCGFGIIKSENEIYCGKGIITTIGWEYEQAFDKAVQTYKEVKFSAHGLTENQREILSSFTDMTTRVICSRRSSFGRFIDRHIRYLY